MQKYKLKNGITVIFEKNSSKSVALEVMFKVGSNYERDNEAGISHFIEHMLFEGTKKRKSSAEISIVIEKYGGEFNAYTTGDRTAFFIKIIKKRFETALDILSDITINPTFDEKVIDKEKDVILKEINMVIDDSRLYQWVLFNKNLFAKHPAKNPTYGRVETVKSFDRKKLMEYYKKYYITDNLIISIVGNVTNVKEKVQKYFGKMGTGKLVKRPYVKEPVQTKVKTFIEKRKILNSYMVLGYNSVSKTHKDRYVFEVITGILGRGQSGWIFDEIRNKRGLAYQVGVHNENESDYGSFSVYIGLDKKNLDKAKQLVLEQFTRLDKVSDKEIKDAKTYIEGSHTLSMEDNFHRADDLCTLESIKDSKLDKDYIKNINKVSIEDIRRVARIYLNDKYTMIVLEQE